MNDNVKYILYSVLDYGLTFGGTIGVIVYNYVTPTNSNGFKLTFSGIILIIALLLTAKAIFEKNYRSKFDTLLKQLAESIDIEQKKKISKELEKHRLTNDVYQRIMLLLPFAILYMVTWLGATTLETLNGTIGLILASMGAGSVFNIIKRPVGDKASLAKLTKKK